MQPIMCIGLPNYRIVADVRPPGLYPKLSRALKLDGRTLNELELTTLNVVPVTGGCREVAKTLRKQKLNYVCVRD